MLLIHKIASWILKRRMEQIEQFIRNPIITQTVHFKKLIQSARHTQWGKKYGYSDIHRIDTFRERVPVNTYEQLYPYIERMMQGEPDVLWRDTVQWFAKSSGTTNAKSKYIPVTNESLEECHFRAGQDLLSIYFHNKPNSKLFAGKTLPIGGSHNISHLSDHARCGDISAVILENMPTFYQLMRTPSKEVVLMADWDKKIEMMAAEVMHKDVTAIAGVPTWTLVLIERILKKAGRKREDLESIWPNLELYVHGGVNFAPYRKQFRSLMPHRELTFMDCYNASEGFFAVQHSWEEPDNPDMLLMLDYGIFYEFVPIDQIDLDHPKTYTLDEVEIGKNYAMIISTNGGLWRYLIGDTVTFTSIYPFQIRITGRTKHFINAFGEELVVENAEKALSMAAHMTGATLQNYTAAPIYFNQGLGNKGGHEWLIEFSTSPRDIGEFSRVLDASLQQLNSDYEAKRTADLALDPPMVRELPKGTFHEWMKSRGKLGGQHKVPRLANDRKYVEDILNLVATQNERS